MKTLPSCLRALLSPAVRLALPCALLGVAVGAGAQAHISYVQSTYQTNAVSFGLAVDASGSVYVPDVSQQNIYKETFANGVPTKTLAVAGRGATNLAVDSAGDLYLASGSSVFKETLSNGVYTESSIGSGFNYAYAIAVDSGGAVYIADNGNNQVVKETPGAGGTYTQSILFTGLNSPEGVAVDSSGDVYISDTNNNRVLKETFSGGTYTQSTLGGGLSAPQGIGLDSHGDVYVVDTGHGRVLREQLQADGSYLQGFAVSLNQELTGIAVSASGILYIPYVQGDEFLTETPTELAESAGTNFGTSPVGTATAPMVLTFSFDVSGSLNATAYSVTTQGVPSLDFRASATQAATACVAGVTYAIGSTCTVTAYFSPTAPGQRLGAVVLYGSDGSDIATAYLQGIGTAPMITYSPGTISALNTGASLVEEQALTVDGVGNVYFYDYPRATYKANVATATLAQVDGAAPYFLAVDGAGNVLSTPYDYDYGGGGFSGTIGTFANKATYSPYAPGNFQYIDSQVATGFTSVRGIAADASGSFFVGDTNAAIIYKETFANAGYNQSVVATGLNKPEGMAVDSTGALYIADTGNGRILLETPANGSYTQSTLFSGLLSPYAVAVDLQGNVYIGQSANNAPVLKETLANGSYTQSTLTNAVVVALGVGNNGNVYLNETAQNSSNIFVIDVADPPGPLAFASTPVGSTSTDSPQTVTINNSGNAPLIFSTPSTGTNPVLSAGFTLAASSTCPQLTPSSPTATIAVGASCTYNINFTPAVAGSISGTLTLTDNALNVAGSTQVIHLTGTGTGGSLSITPNAQPFTATVVGATSSSAVSVITNSTGSAISLSTGTLTDANDFTAGDSCNGSVAANSSCNVTFTFTPKSAGALSSTYNIANINTPNAPLTVALNGMGITPSATLSPASLSFSTSPNTAAVNQSVTLTNNGTATLTIGSVSLSGTNAGAFNLAANGCGTSLAAGNSCNITVGFPANAAGVYTATLTVTDNASPTTQTVQLTSTVSGTPQAAFSPAMLTYATVVNTQANNQTTTLTNAGAATLTITSLAITGTNASSFAVVSNTCGTNLAAGAHCTVTIGFTAIALGSYSATLTAADNASSASQAVSLSGTVSGTPTASVSPASLSFSTNAGTSPASQTSTLTNTGTAPLTITAIAVTGANASAFAQTNTCAATLAVGASCNVNVSFVAATAGTFTASLTVTDNSGSSSAGPSVAVTQTVALSGTAISVGTSDFTLTPTPAAQSSYRGRSVTYAIQVAPLAGGNPFSGPVTLTASGLPSGVMASFSPVVVTTGTQATSTLSVTIPALIGTIQPTHRGPQERTGFSLSLALLVAGFGLRPWQRKRRWPTLFALLCMLGLTGAMTGCGTGNGFAVPTSTSTITITGTSGTIVHTTTVTLTVQ